MKTELHQLIKAHITKYYIHSSMVTSVSFDYTEPKVSAEYIDERGLLLSIGSDEYRITYTAYKSADMIIVYNIKCYELKALDYSEIKEFFKEYKIENNPKINKWDLVFDTAEDDL